MMFKSEGYEISLLSETKKHYFLIYFRDIQRQLKKINTLKHLGVCNFRCHIVCVCMYWIFFFLSKYTYYMSLVVLNANCITIMYIIDQT